MRDKKELIAQMTLEEKASLCSGMDFWHTTPIERLGIPSMMLTDGPHGLRKQQVGADHLGIYNSVPATCFPSGASLASSWDRDLIEKVGVALGEECQAEDVGILLGPGANIKRSPLCGRNFEYFSEDPYLSSEIAAHHIKGVQSQGVGTSLKHFAVNNQEHRRMSTNVVVDERTLREIYLASFEAAVKKAQPWTIMASYNKVQGVYASESKMLLNDILKDDWGFEGVTVSDWGAVNERVTALTSGLELEMPGSYGIGERKIVNAVKTGELSEDMLNKAVDRILTIVFRATDNKKSDGATYDVEAHHRLARMVARDSMVLLKNNNDILPLVKTGTIAVIGGFAEVPRYQGGGSSHINPTKLDSILEEIKNATGPQTSVTYAQGYHRDDDAIDHRLVQEAQTVAACADKVLLFVGLPDSYESEGYDRRHLRLPESHIQLIHAVSQVQEEIVVVLSNGSPVEMPWIDKVKGVLEVYLGGQAIGGAISDVVFGVTNPSGKLAETFPRKLSDTPAFLNFPGENDTVEYREGIFVGYRYYDTKEVEPLFPFGFGLSYTSFSYSDLVLDKNTMKDTDTVRVAVRVKNTGRFVGKEIVQLYVRDVSSTVIRPEKELKGFHKIELQPDEESVVTFDLDKRAFAYYAVEIQDWHVESGEFEILIGKSSRDIVLRDSLHVESTVMLRTPVNRNTLVGDLMEDPVLAPLAKELLSQANEHNPLASAAENGDDAADLMEAMMKFMPLRAFVNFSAGSFTETMLSNVIDQLNRKQTSTVD